MPLDFLSADIKDNVPHGLPVRLQCEVFASNLSFNAEFAELVKDLIACHHPMNYILSFMKLIDIIKYLIEFKHTYQHFKIYGALCQRCTRQNGSKTT